MTEVLPEAGTTMASEGTTMALGAVRPAMETWTAVPGRRVPLGFSRRTQTSTVVLPGSRAGLTRVILPGTGSVRPGTETEAGSPVFSNCACGCDKWIFARRAEVSMTVMKGAPGAGGFTGVEGTVGDDAGDGAANFGIAELGFGALVFAFARIRACPGRL